MRNFTLVQESRNGRQRPRGLQIVPGGRAVAFFIATNRATSTPPPPICLRLRARPPPSPPRPPRPPTRPRRGRLRPLPPPRPHPAPSERTGSPTVSSSALRRRPSSPRRGRGPPPRSARPPRRGGP